MGPVFGLDVTQMKTLRHVYPVMRRSLWTLLLVVRIWRHTRLDVEHITIALVKTTNLKASFGLYRFLK